MLGAILSFLGGPIARQLVRAYSDKQNAETDRERIAADVQIAGLEAEVEARREARKVRLATAGQWEMRVIVFTAGFPPALHFAAVAADSLNWFPMPTVDALPPPMDEWEGAIILSMFGLSAVKLAATLLVRR